MPIHINPNYRVLSALVPEYERRYANVDRDVQRDVRDAGAVAAVEYDLVVGKAAGGARFVTDRGSVLERHSLYALAPVGSEVDAARQIVAWIDEQHGPGNLWTVGSVVDIMADDGKVPCGPVDDVLHVMLRSYYFHEPTPRQQCNDCGAEIIGYHGACEGVPGGFSDDDSVEGTTRLYADEIHQPSHFIVETSEES